MSNIFEDGLQLNQLNLSLSSGVFPKQFKLCTVIPLLKKYNLDNEELSNYRPISHLSFLSKLAERMVKLRNGQLSLSPRKQKTTNNSTILSETRTGLGLRCVRVCACVCVCMCMCVCVCVCV